MKNIVEVYCLIDNFVKMIEEKNTTFIMTPRNWTAIAPVAKLYAPGKTYYLELL